MFAKKSVIYTVLGFVFFFLIGWKGSEYYFMDKLQTSIINDDGTTTIVSNFDNPQTVDLSLYWKVWNKLENSYLDQTKVSDDENLVYGSIKGLVGALDDPYTVFMTPVETKEFEENLNGSLEGIGAELTVEDGMLVVLSPLKNSPAEKAGLKPGDIIFQIDGETTADMTLFDAIMTIRGEKGTTVTLTILRRDTEEPIEVDIVRDTIEVESVTYENLEGDIAYISINQFSDNTTEEFEKAVQDILLKDPKGLILDLRYNGGGYLDISVDILSELVGGDKDAVKIVSRDKEMEESIKVWDNAKLPEVPLVVLVNEGSASASEILAGAIQDHKRGLIMGNQTYGKGSVQEIEMLDDGSSLRLTIAKWLTPSGRDIDKMGIAPDRVIEFSWPEDEEYDSQLKEAYNYLLNL